MYIFNYATKDDFEVIGTLCPCMAVINALFEDFKNFLTTGSLNEKLEVRVPNISSDNLKIIFRMRDGAEIGKTIVRVDRRDYEDKIKEFREKYGDIDLKYDIHSENVEERLFANIEIFQFMRRQQDNLVPWLQYHSKATDRWEMIHLLLDSRAEKIYFWNDFAKQALKEQIDKFYFTSDAWFYNGNKEYFYKTLEEGREISTLSDLKEVINSYYLENSGKIMIAQSFYKQDNGGRIIFGQTEIRESKPEHNAMFTAVFDAWGIKNGKEM